MTRETKIGLLVGLTFIILFGVILSEKGTGRLDQFSTPPIAAYKPVVEIIPPTAPPESQLSRNNKDVADRLTMSESNLKATETKPPADPAKALEPVKEITTPVTNPQPAVQEIAPTLQKLIPGKPTRSLTQIPASTSNNQDLVTTVSKTPTETQPAEEAVLRTHTVKQHETLFSICRQYYPGQTFQMLKKVQEINNITKPEKLMCGQIVKLPSQQNRTEDKTSTLIKSGLLIPVEQTGLTTPTKVALTPAKQKLAKAKTTNKTYVVQSKDTLTKIAKQFYGNQRAWTKIYEYNKKIITDPKNIRDGLKLQIPELAAVPAANQ